MRDHHTSLSLSPLAIYAIGRLKLPPLHNFFTHVEVSCHHLLIAS
jgi:hypothetical protein